MFVYLFTTAVLKFLIRIRAPKSRNVNVRPQFITNYTKIILFLISTPKTMKYILIWLTKKKNIFSNLHIFICKYICHFSN